MGGVAIIRRSTSSRRRATSESDILSLSGSVMQNLLPIPYTSSIAYQQMLEVFHSNWSAIDLYTDFAIYQFLKVTPEQAHLITSGMMFGRKRRLLSDLIKHSSDHRREKLLAAFGALGRSKREIITHSYVASSAISVNFLERNISGSFKATTHDFSPQTFHEHVQMVAKAAEVFRDALEISQDELNSFVNAALSLNKSPTTSGDDA